MSLDAEEVNYELMVNGYDQALYTKPIHTYVIQCGIGQAHRMQCFTLDKIQQPPNVDVKDWSTSHWRKSSPATGNPE